MSEKTPRAEFLAEKLRKLAADRGMNRENVANATGISKPALYRYFDGTAQRPDTFMIVRLARYFGVSVDYLVGTHDDDVEVTPAELVVARN